MTVSTIDFSALAREWLHNGITGHDEGDVKSLTTLLTQSHASGHAKGLEKARAAFAELDAAGAAPFEAGKDNFSPFRRAWDRLARALASSDPAPRDQVADAGAIPHENCKTWDSCRREQVCFDPWNCSAALSAPRPSQPKGETP